MNTSNSSSSDTGTPVGTGGTPLTPGAGGSGSGGSTGPSDGISTAIVDVTSAYDAVKDLIGEPHTKGQRKHTPKVRRQAQNDVPSVFDLTVTHPELLPMGTTSQELFEKLALLARLQPLLTGSTKLHTSVKDKVMGLEGELFNLASKICSIAEKATVVDQGVVAVVERFRASLAKGPRVKHKRANVAVVKTVAVPLEAPSAAPKTGTAGSASEPAGSNAGGSTTVTPNAGATSQPKS